MAIVGTAADIVITFNVKVDGVNRNDFTHLAGIYSWVLQQPPPAPPCAPR